MYTKTIEEWNTKSGTITKIVVRAKDGTFHGATNYKQAV